MPGSGVKWGALVLWSVLRIWYFLPSRSDADQLCCKDMKFYSYYPNKKQKIFLRFVKKLNNISDYQLDILLLPGGAVKINSAFEIFFDVVCVNKNNKDYFFDVFFK